MFGRFRLPSLPPNPSPPDYDLNTLAVPPCGQYTPERWAAALERRDHKRFRFVRIALPRSIFGARLIVCPARERADACPIELIVVSRELVDTILLHTQTHELAHAALGHPTVTVLERDLPKVLQSYGNDFFDYLSCRAMALSFRLAKESRPQEEERVNGPKKKIFEQDLEAERLAQQILGREARFVQGRKNTRLFGEESFEEIGQMLGLG